MIQQVDEALDVVVMGMGVEHDLHVTDAHILKRFGQGDTESVVASVHQHVLSPAP